MNEPCAGCVHQRVRIHSYLDRPLYLCCAPSAPSLDPSRSSLFPSSDQPTALHCPIVGLSSSCFLHMRDRPTFRLSVRTALTPQTVAAAAVAVGKYRIICVVACCSRLRACGMSNHAREGRRGNGWRGYCRYKSLYLIFESWIYLGVDRRQ